MGDIHSACPVCSQALTLAPSRSEPFRYAPSPELVHTACCRRNNTTCACLPKAKRRKNVLSSMLRCAIQATARRADQTMSRDAPSKEGTQTLRQSHGEQSGVAGVSCQEIGQCRHILARVLIQQQLSCSNRGSWLPELIQIQAFLIQLSPVHIDMRQRSAAMHDLCHTP